MASTQAPPSIHYRRRWYYVLWAGLLIGAAAFMAWWETPAREGPARFSLVLNAPDFPAGARGALWIGNAKAWNPRWNPGDAWVPAKAENLAMGPLQVRIAHRRLGQGLLLRRTQDLAIAVLESPSGERRYFVYDLREDLATLLVIGRYIKVETSCSWQRMPVEARLPADEKRKVVGH